MFNLPTFNLTCGRWRPPNAPPALPDITFVGQLYFGSRAYLDITPGNFNEWEPPIFLRVPSGTNILPHDVVEANLGDGWFYNVRFVDRVHRGFPNEYFCAVLEQRMGTPPGPPVAGGFVLMEGTGFVLMEDGVSKIVLE
jgi:hypothetical protein